ncbi:MAG: adenylate/guanylate cyclase domain-containing protein [Spirochaetales bacterium]|nr:adenylate/guanylate cyclase domain-containing protein [Spirochaetales bacterium]
MDQSPSLIIKEHLIAVYDLESFGPIMGKLPPAELFALLNCLQVLTIETLAPHRPLIVKNDGDANFMVFEPVEWDDKVRALLSLKEKLESDLKNRGYHCRASFSAHCGEIAVGRLGKEPFLSLDAFGEPVGVTFIMNGKPWKGRFNISPQLFRKLDAATRKLFHKYTPPVTYLAE